MTAAAILPQTNRTRLLRKVSFLLLGFLCVFIPLRSVLELYISPYVKVIPDILIVLLFIWYAINIRFRFRFLLHDWLFLGFLALGIISSVLINHTEIAPVIFHIRSIGIYYVLYFVIRNLDFGCNEFCRMVTILQIVGIVLFVFSAIEKVSSKTVLFPQSVADGILYASNFSRVYSLFFNPNTYALFLDFVIFLSIFRRISYGVKTSPIVYGILVASLLLSVSRAGIIIMVVGMIAVGIYMVVKHRKELPYKKILLSLVLVFVIGSVGYFGAQVGSTLYHDKVLAHSEKDNDKIIGSVEVDPFDRFDNTLSEVELEQSGTDGRIFTVKKGLEIVQDYPILGTGFGTFGSGASMNFKPAISEKYDLPYPFYADNEYIKVLVENGVLGALVFVAFLGSILFYYRKDWAKILLCVMFGWFGIFYNVFEVQIGAMLLWSSLAFVKFPAFSKDSNAGHRME